MIRWRFVSALFLVFFALKLAELINIHAPNVGANSQDGSQAVVHRQRGIPEESGVRPSMLLLAQAEPRSASFADLQAEAAEVDDGTYLDDTHYCPAGLSSEISKSETSYATFTIKSSPDGVMIQDADGTAMTPYQRTKPTKSGFWMIAPESFNGVPFLQWTKNGQPYLSARDVGIKAYSDTYEAIYAFNDDPCTITICSDPPGALMKDGDGYMKAPYTRAKLCGSTFWLNAPETHYQYGYMFESWHLKDASGDKVYTTWKDFEMKVNRNDIWTAVYSKNCSYAIGLCTIRVESDPPGLWIPRGYATYSFAEGYAEQCPYAYQNTCGLPLWLSAPPEVDDLVFNRWLKNREFLSVESRIGIQINNNDTYTAVYIDKNATPTPSPSPTETPWPTQTPWPSPTEWPTSTPWPSPTQWPAPTPWPTNYVTPTTTPTLTPTPAPPVWLGDALDNPVLDFATAGDAGWIFQPGASRDGSDAIQTARLADNQSASLLTTVQGPGQITFWSKVSSEYQHDFLQFSVGGAVQYAASGEQNWKRTALAVPEGLQTLKWEYRKDASGAAGADASWLDEVIFHPADHILEIAAIQFSSERLGDLRTTFNPAPFVCGERSLAPKISFSQADPAGLAGEATLGNLPEGGALKAALKAGKVFWNAKKQRVEVRAKAEAKDKTTGENYRLTLTAYRQGSNLVIDPTRSVCVARIRRPAPASARAVLAGTSTLANPETIARIEGLDFHEADKKGFLFRSESAVFNWPWGAKAQGSDRTIYEKRIRKTQRGGATLERREYVIRAKPLKNGEFIFRTNWYSPEGKTDFQMSDVKYARFKVGGASGVIKPPQTDFMPDFAYPAAPLSAAASELSSASNTNSSQTQSQSTTEEQLTAQEQLQAQNLVKSLSTPEILYLLHPNLSPTPCLSPHPID